MVGHRDTWKTGRKEKVGKRGAGDMVEREGREEDPLIQMKLHAGLASNPSPPQSDGEGGDGAS